MPTKKATGPAKLILVENDYVLAGGATEAPLIEKGTRRLQQYHRERGVVSIYQLVKTMRVKPAPVEIITVGPDAAIKGE